MAWTNTENDTATIDLRNSMWIIRQYNFVCAVGLKLTVCKSHWIELRNAFDATMAGIEMTENFTLNDQTERM